jgi:hypothetical protein
MNPWIDRMVRAARLEPQVYEEVEADESTMSQAIGVVAVSSVAAGIGNLQGGVGGLLLGAVAAFIAWGVWAFLTWIIGTRLIPESETEADMGQLLRTIGFSASPGVFRALGFLPGIGPLLFFAASVWMLVAMVVAVRQALDFQSTWRAVGVCAIGWLVLMLVQALVFALFVSPGEAGG